MKKCLLAILGLSANLFITGCADDQARQQIADTNQRLSQLQQNLSVIATKVANQKSLDILNQIDNLQNQINQLNGRVSDIEQGKASSATDLAQQLQSLDLRVTALESGGGSKLVREDSSISSAGSAVSNARMLEFAVAKIKSNKIASAIADLKQIINGTDVASSREAYYYLAIAYIADSKYPEAINEANKFIDLSPKSKNVPDAMRVVYIAQTQSGDANAASATAKKLIRLYPNSNAAKKVAKQL